MYDDHEDDGRSEYERSTFEYGAEPWKDPAVLCMLYHDEGLCQKDIAADFDIRQQTISYWMDKLDIETRPPMHERDAQPVRRNELADGKIQYAVPEEDSEMTYFYEHQLVALLEFEPSEVFHTKTHVHHEAGAPFPIDLPENLDVLGAREHIQLHAGGAANPDPEVILREIFGETDSPESTHEGRQTVLLQYWGQRFSESETTEGVRAD